MAPSSVHERCSLRQRYLDRFKGLGLRPLSADVAAGHPCIESVEHILHRRVNRLSAKPPNGQRNRTSQATGFAAHALCALNRRTNAEYQKQRNLSPYRARRGLRDRRNAAISAATAQAVKAAETNGHRQKRHAGDEHARGERPERAAELQRGVRQADANAARRRVSMMNEFCAGKKPPGYAPSIYTPPPAPRATTP